MAAFDVFRAVDDPIQQFLAVLSFHMPRATGFMLFFPLFNKSGASAFIRMAIAASMVAYPAFAASTQFNPDLNLPSLTLLTFLSEVTLGAFLGLAIAFPYYAFRGMGALVDVYRGATFSGQVTGNDSGEELPLETLFGYMFVALILAGPGLHAITVHLLNSYLLMPPGTLTLLTMQGWLQTILRLMADSITFAVLLSGPVLIAVMVVEISVQIISSFAQQLQVYSLEYSLRSLFGIAALLGLLKFAEEDIFTLFRNYSETLYTLLGVPS